MADDAKQAWNNVGERFSSLGKRLADNYNASDKAGDSAKETQRKAEVDAYVRRNQGLSDEDIRARLEAALQGREPPQPG